MTDYPKQDHEIELMTLDNARITGCVNVLGRSIATYLQGSEPDIVMYRCRIEGIGSAETMMVAKSAVIWVHTGEKAESPRIGSWKRVAFHMVNKTTVTGEVDMTGYDRVSDYFQNADDRFYEVVGARSDDGDHDRLYLSRVATIWKEPVS
ncbi:hypothetical protein JCM14469_07370 [Desulfatiferula olefinivorans]